MQILEWVYFLCSVHPYNSMVQFMKALMQARPKLIQGNYKVSKVHHVFIFRKPAQTFAQKQPQNLETAPIMALK